MLKYIFILGGIIISFLSDVFENEQKDEFLNKFKLKKLTASKIILLILGLFISIGGIFYAEYEEKNKNESLIEKAKADSVLFVRKNFSDSLRFMTIINELNRTQRDVVQNSRNIVSITKEESKKQLADGVKNKFLIPNEVTVNFDSDLIIEKGDIEKAERGIYKWYKDSFLNLPKKNSIPIGGVCLMNHNINDTTNTVFNSLNRLSEGIIECSIFFEGKNKKNVLFISNKIGSNLIHWSDYKNRNKSENKDTPFSYYLCYNFQSKQFSLRGNSLKIDIDRTKLATSLLDLEGLKMIVRISAVSLGVYTTSLSYKIKLNTVTISTNDGLWLVVNKFKSLGYEEIGGQNKFEKKLDKNETWK